MATAVSKIHAVRFVGKVEDSPFGAGGSVRPLCPWRLSWVTTGTHTRVAVDVFARAGLRLKHQGPKEPIVSRLLLMSYHYCEAEAVIRTLVATPAQGWMK